MNAGGQLAGLNFPNFTGFSGQVLNQGPDRDVNLIMIKAYNDWHLEEWCGAAPGRFIPLILVPLWDVKEAAKEIERTAAKGARSFGFSEDPSRLGLPSIQNPDRHWEPMLKAAAETEMVVSMHIGTGGTMLKTTPESTLMVTLSWGAGSSMSAAMLDWLFSGVFLRNPKLKVALSEGGIGWMPYFLERAEQVYKKQRYWAARSRQLDTRTPSPIFDVFGGNTDPSFAEAFRGLRTNLYRALPGEHGRVVMFTSPTSGDGKTTCALALAAMLSADNRRVLVIDADVRNPSHHREFAIPQEPGLRNALEHGHAHWRQSVRTVCFSSGAFDALSVGASPRPELLSDPQLASFLVSLRSHYDFILLDSPSFPTVSDPLVLAPLADYVVSVVRLGSTSRRTAEEHISGIFTVARGQSVIVNNVDMVASSK